MPKKVNKPRLTPNQASWLNEYKKLDDIIKRKRKKGYEIPDDILPTKPQRITPKSIAKLQGIINEVKNYTVKKGISNGSGYKRSTPTNITKTQNIKPNVTNKTQRIKPNVTNKTEYGRGYSSQKPHPGNPENLKPHPENLNRKGRPKGAKDKKPRKPRTKSQLPQEVDFIDNEIISYLNKAINNINNSSSNFKYERIHDLESIIYNINNEFVVSKQAMYENIHNNIQTIKELIDIITYDSKQDMVQHAVNEIFNIIFQQALSLEESAKITEQTENWDINE